MKKFFLVIFLGMFLISITSASFELGNLSYNIKQNYVEGESVKGWINISLSDASLNASFETNGGDSITLSDLLELNGLLSECDTPSCNVDYEVSNAEATKILDLQENEEVLVGFKLEKDMTSINTLDFQFESDAITSCYNQFKIDVFNDGSLDLRNENYLEDYCALFRTKGCFDEEETMEEVILSSTPVCQRVELPEAAGFRIGAELTGSPTKKTANFAIYDLDGIGLGSCANSSIKDTGEFFCNVMSAYSEETKEYYVCVTANVEDNIRINVYQDNENGCGFFGIPPQPENYSYNLIAYSLKFGDASAFSLPSKYGSFLLEVEEYLESKYGSLQCATKNCVIPIKVLPNVDQIITFDSLSGTIDAVGFGTQSISSSFYDLSEIPLKYDSDFQKIYLDNASLNLGESDVLSLSFGDEEIFSQDISTNVVPTLNSLSPKSTAAAVTTEFTVGVGTLETNNTITNYEWNFGNGDVRKTNDNFVTYTYNSTGNFNIVITVFDTNGANNSKSFPISVETPLRAVNKTLKEKTNALENLKTQLDNLPVFAQNSLKPIFNIAEVENKLVEIKTNFDSAAPGVADTYYVQMMQDLLSIEIPLSLIVSKSADALPFYSDEEKIDLDALKLLEGDYDNSRTQEYKDAVLSWNLNNLVNTIGYKEISADYGSGLQVLLNVFELDVQDNDVVDATPYFILEKSDSFKFEKNYDKREIEDYVFIPLDSNSKIVFSSSQSISFSDLPLFISPTLSNLNVRKEPVFEDALISKWVLFWLIIFFLILAAVIVYIILQKWYSKRYEGYLFKNKNDLYNLISFIEAAKKKGHDDDKIITSLKKSGWKGEQLTYVIRKYLGKRTGMFEIPINKFLGIFSKKQMSNPNVSKTPVGKRGFNPNARRGFVRR